MDAFGLATRQTSNTLIVKFFPNMKSTNKMVMGVIVVIILIVAFVVVQQRSTKGTAARPLRVSVPPFVDTAFTAVGDQMGFFKDASVNIKLVNSSWENQYELIAGGELDIAMSTVDEFVNKDRNLRLTGNRVYYFLPAWQFRGLAFYTSKSVKPFSEFQAKPEYKSLRDAKNAFLAQFNGKKIVYPEGSVFEQAFRAFCQDTDHPISALPVINAPLDAALNSLSDTTVGIVAVGSQQRFEAESRGYVEAISPESLGLDVVTGFIVRAKILESRRTEVLAFMRAYYRTAQYVQDERKKAYDITNPYLVARGCASLTFEQYQALVAYNVVPKSPTDAQKLFFTESGAAYWKGVWNRSEAALRDAKKGDQVPPDEKGFVATAFNAILQSEPAK